ncbi:bifunctional oligoribonuclease/PAP phosphatase NrnA [Virgibacillus kekensis]|uniref:Bifunctional oligoribonuclease/PAP phosphatase NrnA n=1 Tax=Virgibacillus kekensis TaxID=202261 RepID=A0ABV9DEH5_9BACI
MSMEKVIRAIKNYNTIIIHRHVRPDPDAYGSQAGLRELIKESFPDKQVFLVGEPDPSLEFLASMDQVDDSVYENALVIVCDTANAARICDQRYNLGAELIKIDHHPNLDHYGDVMWVDTDASSTSEMIFDLYQYGKEHGFELNDEAARLLYAGIVGDTGRFLFPSTSKKTFQHAAELVTYNFDRTSLYDGIYSIKDNIARLRGFILQNFTLMPSGRCTVKLTQDILKKFHVSPAESGQLIGVLGDIEGIKAWAFYIEEPDQIRVRLRSKGPVINGIAARYNGGGHPMAAGASVENWEDTDRVTLDLEEACTQFTP